MSERTRKLGIRLLSMTTGLALSVAATGCGSSGSSTPPQLTPPAGLALDDVRHFAGYAVYFAGGTFEGKPITHIQRSISALDLTTISYGSCSPTGEDGCPVPLSITSSSYCARPIQGSAFVYKGAQAEWVSGGLVLWFRDSTVNIIAAMTDANAVEMRVADQLIALNASVVPNARASTTEDLGGVTAVC